MTQIVRYLVRLPKTKWDELLKYSSSIAKLRRESKEQGEARFIKEYLQSKYKFDVLLSFLNLLGIEDQEYSAKIPDIIILRDSIETLNRKVKNEVFMGELLSESKMY